MANIRYLRTLVGLLHMLQRLGVRTSFIEAQARRQGFLLQLQQGCNLATASTYLAAQHIAIPQLAAVQAEAAAVQSTLSALRRALTAHVGARDIPQIIWMYWNRGLAAAPEVVQLAYRSWQEMNPGYEVRFLDDTTVAQYLDINALFRIASLEHTVAHRADYLRTFLLAQHGGVWVDGTCWCWQPLAQWLPQETRDSGFFMFRQPESRQDRQITNWFIASAPCHPIIVAMFHALSDYVFKRRDTVLRLRKARHYARYPGQSRTGTGYPLLERLEREGCYPYFYFHYLFNEVVAQGEPARLWSAVLASRNLHAKNQGTVEDVFVSKQTHKGDYQHTPEYRERKQRLLALLERRP